MSASDADTEVDDEIDAQDTTSTRVRWEYTNDLIAGGYLLAFVLLIGLDGRGLIDLTSVPVNIRLTATGIALIDAAWVFGTAAVRAAAEFRNG